MSTKSELVRARIEPELKEDVQKIFNKLGLTTTEAIRIFLKHVQLYKGLPFKVKIPNEETRKAFAEAQQKDKLESFDTPEELFEDLGI